MAFKNPSSFLFFLLIIISISTPTTQLHHQRHRHHHRSLKPRLTPPSANLIRNLSNHQSFIIPGGGEWALLQPSIGISAMHMQLLHDNKVVIFDRTDFGHSNLSLPAGKCRFNDEAIPVDCTSHSILYDVVSNSFRPLMVQTNVWCSSGAVNPDGTLMQTGGYHAGDQKIRLFTPCEGGQLCDWIELPESLWVPRWYASNHILPDGRSIVVGGRRAFSYEFFPKNPADKNAIDFPFLVETTDPGEENNLYPFLYLLPDGNLYVFANQRSVILDYQHNKIVREFPPIPGEKRSYPSTGSSVMLPLKLTATGSPAVEVLVCGGAIAGSYPKALNGLFVPAAKSCGRIRVTDTDPKWVMEDMPMDRVMPDMLLLPNGDVIIINGASRGAAGWESADDGVLNPVIYHPDQPDPMKRFNVVNPSKIARMYHSAATLLPDGRVLVGGSNPHATYNFSVAKYPTELSLEAFSPPYLATRYSYFRPSILSIDGANDNVISYAQKFIITISLGLYHDVKECRITLVAPSFTTHSFAMNQRLLVLYVDSLQQISAYTYAVTVVAPPNANIAPPGYYMLFVVHQGVPCHSVWFKIR